MAEEAGHNKGIGSILNEMGETLAEINYELSTLCHVEGGVAASDKLKGRIWSYLPLNPLLYEWCQSMQPVVLELDDKRRVEILITKPDGSFAVHGPFLRTPDPLVAAD
jgi:hypothetical protein